MPLMFTLSAPSKRIKEFPEMFPLIVLLPADEGVIENEFQLPLFNCAVAVSVVLFEIKILMFAPVCEPPLIAVNAAPRVA